MNTCVEIKEKVRHLGVILHRKLSWSEHVTTRVDAAKQYSLQLMSAAKTTWGLKPLALSKLYKDVIESTILYAAPVWVVAVKKNHSKCTKMHTKNVNDCHFKRSPMYGNRYSDSCR
ncbi:hypothetical protein QYM36_011282 [Artemia franciscana]|uniref:Uncharacterized protein n=1 Tax=Artemia franciscana TaxID=6661 RepID=A0AA88L4M8_ARTSF|nr:hypothetical protein QYM36_011282 [Artemia franciscana]